MDVKNGIALTQPEITAEEREQIERGASHLRQFLQADPGAKAAIDRALRQHLQGGVTIETWQHILNGLTVIAGEEVTHFLLLSILSLDELLDPAGPHYLALVERHVGPETWSYLRSLMGLYGDEIKLAYEFLGQNAEGWRLVNRRVFYDHLAESWRFTLEIVKYNGNHVALDETPSSATVLCQAILDGLSAVPSEVAQEAIDRQVVEDLAGAFYTFLQTYAPDLLEEIADAPTVA